MSRQHFYPGQKIRIGGITLSDGAELTVYESWPQRIRRWARREWFGSLWPRVIAWLVLGAVFIAADAVDPSSGWREAAAFVIVCFGTIVTTLFLVAIGCYERGAK